MNLEKERIRLQIPLYACLIGFIIFSIFIVYTIKSVKQILTEVETVQTQQIKIIRAKPAGPVVRNVQEEIVSLAKVYGVDPQIALNIADCESTFNPRAKNPNSSAKGIYQFTDGTWDFIGGKDVYDPIENIKMFMRWYPVMPDWWECKK